MLTSRGNRHVEPKDSSAQADKPRKEISIFANKSARMAMPPAPPM
jgi:hypothetical protein